MSTFTESLVKEAALAWLETIGRRSSAPTGVRNAERFIGRLQR